MDVLEREGLQENARTTGAYLLKRLELLKERHPLIGDVRGAGLFLGVELVRDRETLEPATTEAGDVVNRMREAGVLASTDGPFDNVIKIKPPMVFGPGEADILAEELDCTLGSGPKTRAP
jgi:4-aminobutyrate aminotransferase-like enzyme